MIIPTVGRVVLYHQWLHTGQHSKEQSATVTGVYQDPRIVDVTVFPRGENPVPLLGIRLLQDDDKPEIGESYCRWMDYQKGQAAKTEAAEAKAAELESQSSGAPAG